MNKITRLLDTVNWKWELCIWDNTGTDLSPKTTYFELLVVFPVPCNQTMRYLKIHDYCLLSFPISL